MASGSFDWTRALKASVNICPADSDVSISLISPSRYEQGGWLPRRPLNPVGGLHGQLKIGPSTPPGSKPASDRRVSRSPSSAGAAAPRPTAAQKFFRRSRGLTCSMNQKPKPSAVLGSAPSCVRDAAWPSAKAALKVRWGCR